MRLFLRPTAILLLAGLLASLPAMAADQPAGVGQDEVLSYLEQLVTWQRDAVAIEPAVNSARELIFQDALHQNSLHVLQSGFKFAHSIAANEPDQPMADDTPDTEASPHERITLRAQQADSQVKNLTAQIAKTSGSVRANLQDQLKLAQAQQQLYQSVLSNMNTVESGESHGFLGKVNNLMRAVPELAGTPAKSKEKDTAADKDTASATSNTPHSATSILTLMSDSFDITRKQRELSDFLVETNKLDAASHKLLTALRGQLDTVTAPTKSGQSIDAKVNAYKQIAAEITPLGDATLWVGLNKNTIQDWQDTLNQQLKSLLRQLAVHSAILAVTLAIPLIISAALKRTIKRYVGDPKRQRQAQTARRILTGIVIVFILLLNFISDFSSFATFAGFLTAGLAVALQSVLLSFVCHFFFYGRYGVRKGDRVSVSGVTGDILQIGIMRFYLSELSQGEGGTFKPTGRVVVFPNSILFQPSAFYKYV